MMTENGNQPDKKETTNQVGPNPSSAEPQKTQPAGDAPRKEPPKTLRFPKGIWKSIDYLIHNPELLLESLRSDSNLPEISKVLAVISIMMSVIYGAVMGATNLLQGSALTTMQELFQILITAVKVPVLYLLTLAIVFPPVYVLNAFVGARLSFTRMITLLLSSVAITTTALASMATVAFFFALTSSSYNFIKLLHVAVFAYAGLTGLSYLIKSIKTISTRDKRPTPQWLFIFWLVLYMFVGTQLAWVLRPFVGSPSREFMIFRPRSGNFYESVLQSLRNVTGEENDPPQAPNPRRTQQMDYEIPEDEGTGDKLPAEREMDGYS